MTPRLFRALSLASAGVLLVVVVPSNALIGLPELLNGILLAFGMLSLGCFMLARRGVFLYRTFFVILLATLDLAWFVTAGGQGSVNMWLYTGAVSAVVFFRGRRLVIAFGAFLANGCGLYFVEYRWPHLVIPYPDEWVRLLDLVSGLVFSSGTCAVVVWVVLDSYRRERRHLSETVAELERKGAEVHALRGMLPVCAWCKKVRTDTGLWTQVERYLATLPDVQLTHALCPDCQTQHFPDVPTEP
ncbi:MAG: hypothetical protein IPK07_13610 [Deltaproteobacteria bacterium]|nr:hypothetical protein [Deltaproteobacteria bacterium]